MPSRMDADAPLFSVGDFVCRRLDRRNTGQIVAIIFGLNAIAYRVRFPDDLDEFEGYELTICEEPDNRLFDQSQEN
jgi:hypothetical protein